MNNILGDRIKKEREIKCLSQEQLAEQLGLAKESRQTISAWESGKRKPSIDLLEKLCVLYDCDLDYLLGHYEYKTRGNTDIYEETGLSESAIDTLRNLTENETVFLNKLLEARSDLYCISTAYYDFMSKKTLDTAVNHGFISDDYSPDTLCIRNNLDYARFTLMNRFMLFSEK